jgi:hypothetical protein
VGHYGYGLSREETYVFSRCVESVTVFIGLIREENYFDSDAVGECNIMYRVLTGREVSRLRYIKNGGKAAAGGPRPRREWTVG